MISDVCSDAANEIRDYLKDYPHYYVEVLPLVTEVLAKMDALRVLLDTTPSQAAPIGAGAPLTDLIAARDGARAADRIFQDVAFGILEIGREVPFFRDGAIHQGRVIQHGTKGEWWYWTMVWVRDSRTGGKICINVVDIIRAIGAQAALADD